MNMNTPLKLNRWIVWPAVAVLVAVVLVACGGGDRETVSPTEMHLASSSVVRTVPSVTWSPQSITQTMKPGETKTATVTLTANQNTPSAAIRVVPEIAPYVTASPATIGALTAGQSVQVTLTFTARNDALPRTATGTVQLSTSDDSGNTLAKPLPVTTQIAWPTTSLSSIGIDIAYPPSWFAHSNRNSTYFSNMQNRPPLSVASLQSYAFFKVGIRHNDNPLNLPIGEWFTKFLRPIVDDRLNSQTSTIVNGQPAIAIEISEVGGPFTYIYVARQADVVEISYPRFTLNFLDTYAAILASIRIL